MNRQRLAVDDTANGGPRPSRFGPGFDPAALATSEEAREAMDALGIEVIAITEQIERACARLSETGQKADSSWLIAARTALGHRRRMRQRVQERFGELRRAERQAAHVEARPYQEFWYAAREMLTEEEFTLIAREAARRAGRQAG